MIAPEKYYPSRSHNGYPVYSSTDNAVIWHCDTKSLCAYPPPAEWGIPEYFFLLQFSNEYVRRSVNFIENKIHYISLDVSISLLLLNYGSS